VKNQRKEITCNVASINLVCSSGSIGTLAASPASRSSVRDRANESESFWQIEDMRVSGCWKQKSKYNRQYQSVQMKKEKKKQV
jgi:hypothetical protein